MGIRLKMSGKVTGLVLLGGFAALAFAHLRAGEGAPVVFAAQSGGILGEENAGQEELPGDYALLARPLGKREDYLPLFVEMPEHEIQKGECLWGIAQSSYEDGGKWRDIAACNHLENPGLLLPGQVLQMPDREVYLQVPFLQKRKKYYLEDAGAFRFETPERWAMGTCSLDARLSTFMGEDRRGRILWGVEDNLLGENAWSGDWDQVCASMEKTAQTVFGERLEELSFEKYRLRDDNEVYFMCCSFTDEGGERRKVSAAYRFGAKNLMEFIGIQTQGFLPDIGRLTLYTAATYEEYEEERHIGFGENTSQYRGMEVWEYPMLHNPFVLAWEQANGKDWRIKKEPEALEADAVVEWKEPVLLAVVREALQIEGDVFLSDLMQVETLEVVESAGYDFCSINGVRYETDFGQIGSGDALVEDIACFGGLYALRIQIGDITDLSPLENLTVLEELEVQTGPGAKALKLPGRLGSLSKCTVEKAPLQEYVDLLDGALWERTCREQGITTFRPGNLSE